MQRVGDILPAFYRKQLQNVVDQQALVTALWPSVVGEAIARRTRVSQLSGATLVVEAATPAWRDELVFRAGQITGQLNAAVGREVVRELRLVLGRREPQRAATAAGGARDEADAIADPHLRRLYRISRRRREAK